MSKPPRVAEKDQPHSRPQRSNTECECNHNRLVYLSDTYINEQRNEDIDLFPIEFDSAHLAPVPRGVPADNLLLAAVDGKDITVSATVTGDIYPQDTVELVVNGTPTGVEVEVGSGVSIKLNLPASFRTPGQNTIHYLYHIGGSSNPISSPQQFFVVDLTPPGQGGLPKLQVDFNAGDGLTEDKLVGIKPNRFLVATITAYEGLAAGDFIVASIDGNLVAGSEFDMPVDIPSPIKILFPEKAIRDAGDGERELKFTAKDRAGNVSEASPSLTLNVLIKGTIDNLRKPKVPKATDGIINAAEARDKLQFIIPEHVGNSPILPGDQLVLVWGQFESDPINIPAGRENRQIPLTIVFKVLYDEWKRQTGGADRAVDTPVYYKVVRNGLTAGTSEKLQVRINLFHVGGDPSLDPDNLLHPKLFAASLESSSGKSNEIPADDFDNARDATIKTQSVNTDFESILLPGDKIKFEYGNYHFEHTVKAGEGQDGNPIKTVLLGDKIKAEGIGLKPLKYAITREVDGPTENTSNGPMTPVLVSSDGGSGPEKPPVGRYEPMYGDEQQGYYTIDFIQENDIYFIAPAYDGKTEGDIMKLQLMQYRNASHNTGDEDALTATLIETIKTVAKGEEHDEWRVPLPKDKLLAGNAISHMHSVWTVTRNGKTEPSDTLPHVRFQTRSRIN